MRAARGFTNDSDVVLVLTEDEAHRLEQALAVSFPIEADGHFIGQVRGEIVRCLE
jgi:hypothetical protein